MRRIGMKIKDMMNIALIAALCAVGAQPAAAEFEGNIEVGGTQVTTDNESSKFMEYRGSNDGDGIYLLSDIDLIYGSEAFYLGLTGTDLGLDTRNILFESGKYGRYRFYIEYDQLPKFISNTSRTIFDGAGSDNLTLPSTYVGNGSTTNPKTLIDQIINGTNGLGGIGNLRDVDLKLERKSVASGFSMTYLKGLIDFNLSARQEKKEGTKSLGAVVQSSLTTGGGPRTTMILPEPVDYTTNELKASVAYNRKNGQIGLEYYLSSFDNAKESLSWENPYFYGAANPVISLPPDNRYQRTALTGGLDLPLSSRITVVAEYGKMTQNEDLLPYHADPTSAANGTEPRDSAEAEIDTRLFNVNLTSRPISRLNISARYRNYETDNKTKVNLFQYSVADGQNNIATTGTGGSTSIYADGTSASTLPCSATNPCYSFGVQGQAAINSSRARYNEPFDYEQKQLKLDVSYVLPANTTLSAGYDQDVITRDHREADKTKEDTYRAGLRTNISDFAALGGKYLKGKRSYDEYSGAVNLESHTQDYIDTTLNAGTNPRTWINHPDLRKYDVANRDRENYSAYLTVFAVDTVTLGVNYSNGNDDYPDTLLGLTETSSEAYTVDASFNPAETVAMYGYYTNERLRSMQIGRALTSTTSSWYDTTRDWTSANKDSIDTLGAGLNLSLLKGKLSINPDYTYARSKTVIDLAGGGYFTGTAAIEPLPDLKTERHTLNVTARYKMTENWTVGAGYLYEMFRSNDWATDNVTLDDTSTVPTNLIPLSDSVPNYVAHAGSITVAYRW